MTTAEMYRAPRSEARATTEAAPDLLVKLRCVREVVASFSLPVDTTTMHAVRTSEADVARLMEWLESDSLDWEAVANARRHGW
jgi:hypothetical protein